MTSQPITERAVNTDRCISKIKFNIRIKLNIMTKFVKEINLTNLVFFYFIGNYVVTVYKKKKMPEIQQASKADDID